MYIRSRVRYNCYCMLKGNPPKEPEIVEVIQQQLTEKKFAWSEFNKLWDVVVKPDRITVVPHITDITRVTEVCLQAALYAKQGLEFDFNDQDSAIVDMIEANFLEGKMTWSNYRNNWNIRWNFETNRIETFLTNVNRGQLEVTDEMIQKKIDEQLRAKMEEARISRQAVAELAAAQAKEDAAKEQ